MSGYEVGRVSARLDAIFDDKNFDKFDRAYDAAKHKARGDIRTDVGADVNERQFGRAEGLFRKLRGDSVKDAKVDVKADVDERSFNRADRAMRGVDKSQGDLVRGSGRLRTGFSSLVFGGAGIAAGATAFYGLAKGIGFATDAFAESERVQKQTETVIKSTGGAANITAQHVGNLAGAISKYSGIDDEAVQSGENLLLTFTNVRNEVGKGNDIFDQATKTAADMSTALGQDLKSSNIQLGKSLNDPIKGITALSRVGVSFTAQQKDQIKTLVDSGKTLDAQKIILGELNKEFGGSAKAAGSTFTGSMNKMKVAVGNAAEVIGGKLAPILTKVAGFITHFVTALTNGSGAGNRFRSVFQSVGAVFSTVGRIFLSVGGFIGKVINDNRATIDKFGDIARKNFTAIVSFVKRVGASFSDIFGGSTGRDVRSIIKVIGQFAATIADVAGKIARRILPSIANAFSGVMQSIRGVIRIISGIIHGDFSKVWQGAKDIVSGAVKAFGSILAGAGGILLSGIKKGFSGLLGFVGDLPGKFLDIGKRMVSGLARGIAGLPGALAGALGNFGSFMANIGRGIADWINAHTPFGDSIKVGPIHVRLPALAQGGVVGPTAGGARFFIAGEGNKDEWVISQEGDRKKNIEWARDALETLSGKSVAMHAGGKGGKKKAKKHKVQHNSVRDVLGKTGARSVARGERGIDGEEDKIQRLEREYDQLDRVYGDQDPDSWIIENDDGSTTVDTAAVKQRDAELDALSDKRKQIKKAIKDYRDKVKALIKTYKAQIKKLSAAKKAAKGKVHKKDRQNYESQILSYQDRISELGGVFKDLGLDLTDQDIDLSELKAEKTEIDALKNTAAPSSGDDGGGDTSTGDGTDTSTDTGDSAPSPSDIAAAAVEQLSAFQSARDDLFGSFGSNFVNAGSSAFADATQQAAGTRYFGATQSGDNGTSFHDGAIQKQVNVTNNYDRGPEDPMTHSAGIEFFLGAS